MSVKVIVVNDQREVLNLIRDTAATLGWCEVFTTSNPGEAVEHMQNQKGESYGPPRVDRLPYPLAPGSA